MLKLHFPLLVKATDVDGIERRCHCVQDIINLVKEQAERHASPEAVAFLKAIEKPAPVPPAPAKAPEVKKPAAAPVPTKVPTKAAGTKGKKK